MAYDSLKNIIRQYIKTNGEQEITGQIMQNVLIEMVNNYPSTEGCIRANLSNLANGDILIYDSVGAWYNTPLSSFFNGYATQLWVNQQGYVTSSALAGYIHPTITDLANGDILIWDSVGAWVNAPLDTTISGFGYVKNTGSVAYATSAGSANILGHSVYENPAHAIANGDMLVYDSGTGWTNVETSSILSGYATQSWVNQQGFLTSSALNGYIHPTLTNLANGDVLIYDSVGSWVNAPLDTTIAGFGYITSSALANYLPLSGGTISKQSFGPLYIKRDGSNFGAAIGFINSNGTLGYIGFSGNADGPIKRWSGDTNLTYDVWDSSNFSPSDYLPLTGGTLCGGLAIGKDNAGYYLDNGDGQKLRFQNYTRNYYAAIIFKNGKIAVIDNPGIITSVTPAYLLDVNGSANATTLYENGSRVITTGNIGSQSVNYATSAGSANILGHGVSENTAHSLSNGDTLVYDSVGTWVNVACGLSDIRQKSVISYEAEPMFEAVANAPAIRFTWKDATYSFRRGIHVGSIAQYWQTTIPEAVTMDNEGMLSMQYDVIALLSTISVAKKVSEHERRIVILERENEELRKELAALKSA